MQTINRLTDRLTRLQQQLAADTALLLSDPADITYYSGFRFLVPAEREGLLMVTKEQAFLIQASFSPTIDNPQISVLMGSHFTQLESHIKNILKQSKFKTLLLDKSKLFADEYEVLLKFKDFTIESLNRNLIWQQRMVKDLEEVELITRASQIAVEAFQQLQPKIKPGVTEIQLQQWLDMAMFELGAEAAAFPTIVAFGPHSALPHHQPTQTVLEENTTVLFDFGAMYEGYRSDISRTMWVGKEPTETFQLLETIVKEAYQAVMKVIAQKITQKLTARDVDEAARSHISRRGYGNNFIHTTGHGVGLDIHEQPSLYLKNNTRLEPGMVVTIEPGIYLADNLGYRYENTVVLTDTGYIETTVEA